MTTGRARKPGPTARLRSPGRTDCHTARTGLKGRSVVQVSREILSICGNDLARLSRMTPAELSRLVPGIGPTKAITLMAAIELGARCQSALTLANDMPQITSSERIYSMMRPRLERLRHEEFWVLMLNRANRVESRWMVSQGGMAATVGGCEDFCLRK